MQEKKESKKTENTKLNTNDKNFRYDYFMIWSPGLKHKDEIIKCMEDQFEILEIFDYEPKDLNGFIHGLYIYDSLPKEHIVKKAERVAATGKEMLILFVKHHNPDFNCHDNMNKDGRVCWKSFKVRDFKSMIRKKLVPGDNMWAIPMIHGSDYEEQVDHLLKLMDRQEGIEYLYDKYGKPNPVLGTMGNSYFDEEEVLSK